MHSVNKCHRESFKRKCFEDVAEVNGGKLIVPLINAIVNSLLHLKVKGKNGFVAHRHIKVQ